MADDLEQVDKKQVPELKNAIHEYIFIKKDLAPIDFVFEAVKKLDGPLRDTGRVFSDTLVAVYSTATALWIFARNTARKAAYLTMYGVAMGVDRSFNRAEPDPERGERVRESLHKDLKEPKWSEKRDQIAEQLAYSNLDDFLDAGLGKEATTHISRQCTVLTWSAFEVLTSDLFVFLMNTNPKLSALLFENERTRKLYQAKDFMVALEEYDYDLSRSMGEVLLRQHRMDNLEAIRVTYDVLFKEDEALRDLLDAPQLWRLYKTRDLVVHRAAVVDEMFLKSTGINAKLCSKLRITAQELEDYIILVSRVGVELIKAVSKAKASSSGMTG